MDSLQTNKGLLTTEKLQGRDPNKYLVKYTDAEGKVRLGGSRTWGERAVASLPNFLKDGVLERFLMAAGGPSKTQMADRRAAMDAFVEQIREWVNEGKVGENGLALHIATDTLTGADAIKVFNDVKALEKRTAQHVSVNSGVLASHGVLPGKAAEPINITVRANKWLQSEDLKDQLSNKLGRGQPALRIKGGLGHDLARIPTVQGTAVNESLPKFYMLGAEGKSGFYMLADDKGDKADNTGNFDARSKQLEALFCEKYPSAGTTVPAGHQALRELSMIASMDGIGSLLHEMNKQQTGELVSAQPGSAQLSMEVSFDDSVAGSILIKFEYRDKPEVSYDRDFTETKLDLEKSFQNFSGTVRLTPSAVNGNEPVRVEALEINHRLQAVPIIEVGNFEGRSVQNASTATGGLRAEGSNASDTFLGSKPLAAREVTTSSTQYIPFKGSYNIDAKLSPEHLTKLYQSYQADWAQKVEEATKLRKLSSDQLLAECIHPQSVLSADLARLAWNIGGREFDYGKGEDDGKGNEIVRDLPDRAQAIVDLLTDVCTQNALKDENSKNITKSAQDWAASMGNLISQALVLNLNGLNNEGKGLLPVGLKIIGQGGNSALPRIKMASIMLENGTHAVKISATSEGPITIVEARIGAGEKTFTSMTDLGHIDYGVDLICYPPQGNNLSRIEVLEGYTKVNLQLPESK